MKGAFGAAKPLPGQTGYKVSESAVLEKEAKDMETRLKALQDKMAMQQLEDESVTKVGGARWRSAREDKGTIHSYAKDVKERQQKAAAKSAKINLLTGQPVFSNTNPLSDSVKAAPAAAAASSSLKINFTSHVADENVGNHSRQQEQQNASPGGKAGDSPSAATGSAAAPSPLDWTSEQVGEWLSGTVGLPQYADVFAKNEMHGELLLDLSLADLDYMSVSVLAHRKKILKAVEGLRVRASSAAPSAGRGGGNMRGSSSATAMKELPKAPVGTEAVNAPAPGQQHTVHWSHLQPLQQNEVTNEPMMPNAADGGVRAYSKGGEDDVLDEAAEQAAFREAVMAWRTSGKAVTAASSSSTQASTATVAATITGTGTNTQGNGGSPGKFSLLGGASSTAADVGGGGWSDPFAARPQMNDDDDDDDDDDILGEKREAKMRQQQQQAASANRGPLSGVKTVGGMQIAYQPMTEAEELREREEFKKAVMQWRKDNGKGDAGAAQTEVPKASSSGVGTITGLNNNSVDSITDRLARQLDSQYESNARKLEEQKAAARLQMEKAARDLELARTTRPAQPSAQNKLQASMTDCSDDEDDGYVNIGGSSSSADKKDFTSPSSHPDGDGDGDGGRAARLRLPLSGMKVAAADLPRTTPRIDLVDSTITYTARGDGGESKVDEAVVGAEVEVQYLVEEASDDDDA